MLWCERCFFANYNILNLLQVKGKMNQTVYQSITQYHAILSRVRQVTLGFVLMQDKDAKNISKPSQRYKESIEEQHVFQVISWLAQSVDLNPMELMGDERNGKTRSKQPTTAALAGKLGRTTFSYLHSVVETIPIICKEAVTVKVGPFWRIKV